MVLKNIEHVLIHKISSADFLWQGIHQITWYKYE